MKEQDPESMAGAALPGRAGKPVAVDPAIESAIRRLRFELTDAMAHCDVDGVVETFAPDGVWLGLGMRVEGRDAIRSLLLEGIAKQTWQVANFCQDAVLSATNTEVHARAYFIEHMVGNGAITYVLGSYDEVCVKRPEGWRYAERKANVIYAGPPDLSAPPMQPNRR